MLVLLCAPQVGFCTCLNKGRQFGKHGYGTIYIPDTAVIRRLTVFPLITRQKTNLFLTSKLSPTLVQRYFTDQHKTSFRMLPFVVHKKNTLR